MTEQKRIIWRVDPNHSQVQFKVKHLAISNVAGTFKVFEGELQSEKEDFSGARVHFEMAVDSLDTNSKERDKHLLSPEFLNVDKYPKIAFEGILEQKAGEYVLVGNLGIAAVTKRVSMQVEYTGTGVGRFNDRRAGFEVSGKIKRTDYNLHWNILTEAGGFVIGDEIKLHFDIQLIRHI